MEPKLNTSKTNFGPIRWELNMHNPSDKAINKSHIQKHKETIETCIFYLNTGCINFDDQKPNGWVTIFHLSFREKKSQSFLYLFKKLRYFSSYFKKVKMIWNYFFIPHNFYTYSFVDCFERTRWRLFENYMLFSNVSNTISNFVWNIFLCYFKFWKKWALTGQTDMLLNVQKAFFERVCACFRIRGLHFEHFLFNF